MELTTLLERLRMDHVEAQRDGICEQAAKGNLGDKGFLAHALEAEWRGHYQRGVESRLTLARFPWIKTLERFDFDFQPSIDRKVIRELAALSFVERAKNVVLLARPAWERRAWPSPSGSRPWRPAIPLREKKKVGRLGHRPKLADLEKAGAVRMTGTVGG